MTKTKTKVTKKITKKVAPKKAKKVVAKKVAKTNIIPKTVSVWAVVNKSTGKTVKACLTRDAARKVKGKNYKPVHLTTKVAL